MDGCVVNHSENDRGNSDSASDSATIHAALITERFTEILSTVVGHGRIMAQEAEASSMLNLGAGKIINDPFFGAASGVAFLGELEEAEAELGSYGTYDTSVTVFEVAKLVISSVEFVINHQMALFLAKPMVIRR